MKVNEIVIDTHKHYHKLLSRDSRKTIISGRIDAWKSYQKVRKCHHDYLHSVQSIKMIKKTKIS